MANALKQWKSRSIAEDGAPWGCLKVRKGEEKIRELLKEAHKEDKWEKSNFDEYKFNVPFNFAARLVRAMSEDHIKVVELLTFAGVDLSGYSSLPLMAFGNTPSTIKVFKNVRVKHPVDDVYLQKVCYLLPDKTLEPFLEQVKIDLESSRTSTRWASPSRSWKQIKRYDELETGRVLTRVLELDQKLNLKPDKIRNMAQAFENERKPMQLLFAEKPTDFLGMYANSPSSCMVYSSGRPSEWQCLNKNNVHPTSFFAYHPRTRGAYIQKKGVTIARCIVYRTLEGEEQYGRVYSSNEKVREKFIETLAENGIRNAASGAFTFETEFDVPGVKYNESPCYIMPTPSFDNLSTNSMDIRFNQDTKMFHIKTGKGLRSTTAIGSCGYIMSSSVPNLALCKCCGKSVLDNQRTPVIVLRAGFCSNTCMEEAGYGIRYNATTENLSVVQLTKAMNYSYIYIKGLLNDGRSFGAYFTSMMDAATSGYCDIVVDDADKLDKCTSLDDVLTAFKVQPLNRSSNVFTFNIEYSGYIVTAHGINGTMNDIKASHKYVKTRCVYKLAAAKPKEKAPTVNKVSKADKPLAFDIETVANTIVEI